MKFKKIYQLIKKSFHKSKENIFSEIPYQQIEQTLEVAQQFTQKLTQYVQKITPLNFFCKILSVFSQGIIVYLILNVIDVGFSIGLTFINKNIASQMKQKHGSMDWGVLLILLQIFAIKFFTGSLLIIKYIVQGKVAGKIFAFQITNISHLFRLKNINHINGQRINFIQDDSQKITKIPYLLSHSILLPTQVIVLSILLKIYLPSQMSYFLGIILVFILICVLIGFFSYRINKKMMKNKDKRIQSNLTGQELVKHRKQQIKRVKHYLFLRMIVQLIAQIGYTILFIFVFWVGQNKMTKDDKYTALMLLNLLKSPLQRLTEVGLGNMENYASLQRISKGTQINLQSSQQNNNKTSNQITNSLITDQSIQNTQERKSFLSFQKFVKRKGVLQRGNVNFRKLFQKIREAISIIPFILLLISFLYSIAVTIYSHLASQSVIQQKFHPQIIIPIALQNSSLIFMSCCVIYISLRNSHNATKKMSKVKSLQVLNRYSGDIRALDRSTSTNSFQFFSIICVLIGTLGYTTIQLQEWLIQLCFILFSVVLIFIAYRINRYSMWSRRQLMRMQCLKKAQLIGGVSSQNKDESKILKVARQLYVCKVVGMIIQSFMIGLTLAVSGIICLGTIFLCLNLNTPEATTLILLNFLMSMDTNIKSLLLNGLNLQLCLVSVERCLNADQVEKLQEQNNQTNQNNVDNENDSQRLIQKQNMRDKK